MTLVVGSAPGGTTDLSARMLAEPLAKILQATVVVDNRSGGSGNIAGQMVARAPADGSTLLVQYSGYQSITPLLQPAPGFDPGRDLKPIGHLIDAAADGGAWRTSPPAPSRNSWPTCAPTRAR